VVVKENQVKPSIESALHVFTSNLHDPSRVNIVYLELGPRVAEEVVELAKKEPYDFILVGHSELDVPSPSDQLPSGGRSRGGVKKSGSMEITAVSRAASNSLTPPRRGTRATRIEFIMGTLGGLLLTSGVESSLLVVHKANGDINSSSLSFKVRQGKAGKPWSVL